MKRFEFNAAKKLYERGIHPRLLLGPEDIDKLRRQTKRGAGRKILAVLRPGVQSFVKEIHECNDPAAWMRKHDSHQIMASLYAYQAAMVGLLDRDERMIASARALLLASARDNRIDPLGYDLLYPILTRNERELVVRVFVKDIRRRIKKGRMYYYASSAGNLTLADAMWGLWALLAIKGDPEAPVLAAEQAELLRRYEATLYTIVHPDGYPEEDIGYGTLVVGFHLLLGEALRRAGLFDPYRAYEGLCNFGQAMLHFVQPWGEALSNTGDHGSTFTDREFSLPRIASETRDPSVLWLAGVLEDAYRCFNPRDDAERSAATVRVKGRFIIQASFNALLTLDDLGKGVHPKLSGVPTAFCDRKRGIVTFRSGWDKDDVFVVFDGAHRSPAAAGHWHASAAHFSLSALGEMFAIDTGRYNMEQNQHNMVIVDGKSGCSTQGEWACVRRHGQLLEYAPDPLCDVAAADSSLQSDCYWARRWLGLVKGGQASYVWTVEDVNKDDDWHEFWWQIQTSPRNLIVTRKNGATITGWRCGHHLDIALFLLPGTEFPRPHTLSCTQDINRTSSYKYVPNAHAHAAQYARPERMAHGPCFERPRLIAKVTGYNGRFMTVLTPRRKGGERSMVRQLECVPASFAAEVTIGEYRDTIVFAYEHGLLEAGDIVGRGQWAVVRRRRANGRVVAWTLGRGRSLSVAGRTLVSNRNSS